MKLLTREEVKGGMQRNQQEVQRIEQYLAKQIKELNEWTAKKQEYMSSVLADCEALEKKKIELVEAIEVLKKSYVELHGKT